MTLFDDAAGASMQATYAGPDATRRRQLALDLAALVPGETVLEVGPGPGFVLRDVLTRLGGQGTVLGVERSPDMAALARDRVGEEPGAQVVVGEATQLPAREASCDVILLLQVLAYVSDVPTALREVRRVLRPGGRLVVWDTDWGTVSWASSRPELMRKVLDSWEGHVAHPRLPTTLRAELERAGLRFVREQEHEVRNDSVEPGRSSRGLIPLIRARAVRHGLVPVPELDAWEADLFEQAARGRYAYRVRQTGLLAERR